MTQDQWMKEAERLAMDFAHCYAFVGDDTMPKAKAALLAHLQQRPLPAESQELPELPQAVAHVHSNGEVCMERAVESNGVWPVELVTLKQAHDYARAYAAGRPLPVREATVLDTGFKYENGIHTPTVLVGFAPSDYDARDAFARALRSPSLPVREEPTPLTDERILHLWDIYVGYETGAPSARKMPLSNEDKLTFARAVLAASSPSVQNMGEGETGKDGVNPSHPTALERFNRDPDLLKDESPLERLRYFLSLALNGQDWLDVEQFLDALGVDVPLAGQRQEGGR